MAERAQAAGQTVSWLASINADDHAHVLVVIVFPKHEHADGRARRRIESRCWTTSRKGLADGGEVADHEREKAEAHPRFHHRDDLADGGDGPHVAEAQGKKEEVVPLMERSVQKPRTPSTSLTVEPSAQWTRPKPKTIMATQKMMRKSNERGP